MNINKVTEIVEDTTTISELTKEKLKFLLEKIQTNINILKINDDILEVYLHMKEIQTFFDDDIPDTDILLNVLFGIPEISEFLPDDDDADDNDEQYDSISLRKDLSHDLNNLYIMTTINTILSFTSILISLYHIIS